MSVLSVKSLAEQFLDVSLEESLLADSSLQDDVDCDLCGKIDDGDDIPVVPHRDGDLYRLKVKSAGLYRCLITGIKFEVTCAATIEYKLDCWKDYMKYLVHHGAEVLGPLFNVTSPPPPGTVSAVYLPHSLCLKTFDGDRSWIGIAHFKDGDFCVETPTRISPFHVVLANPSFSSLGVGFFLSFWNFWPECLTKLIPIHARVLLYFQAVGRQYAEFKLHLYLMHIFASVGEDFHKEKARNNFRKLDKSAKTTKTVRIKRKYAVNCSVAAHITNQELEVECRAPLEIFAEITIGAAVQIIDLWLEEKGKTGKVWECRLSKGDLEQLYRQVSHGSQGENEESIPQVPQNTRPQGGVEELRPQVTQNTGPQGHRTNRGFLQVQMHKSKFLTMLKELKGRNQLTNEEHAEICNQGTLGAMIDMLTMCLRRGSKTRPQEHTTRVHIENERSDNQRNERSGLSKYIEIPLPNLILTSHGPSNGSDFESDKMEGETDSDPDVPGVECVVLIPQRHFVDEQREALIEQVPHVAPILDSLMTARLLTNENYEAILASGEKTSQDQMRSLYRHVRVWKDHQKDILYGALKTKYPTIVMNLQQPQP